MLSNAFCSIEKVLELKTYRYYPTQEIEPRLLYGTVNSLCNKFYRMNMNAAAKGGCVYVAEGEKKLPETIESGNFKFKRDINQTLLSPKSDRKLISNIIREPFLRNAELAGFTGRKGQKLHSETPHSKKYIDIYDGFQYEVEVLLDGTVLVWIDPASVWRLPATKYVRTLRNDGLTEEEIIGKLVGSGVRVPSVRSHKMINAEIASVKFIPIGEHEVKDVGLNLYDYWQTERYIQYLRTNKIKLERSDSPVLSVKYPGMSGVFDFPAKLCELHIDLEATGITEDVGRKMRFETEKDHVRETEKIALCILGKGLQVGENNLTFSTRLIDWRKVDFGIEQRLTIPALTFGKSEVSSQVDESEPNIRNSLRRYGPVTVREKINVFLLIPKHLETYAESFVAYLNEVGIDLKLPILNVVGSVYVSAPEPDEYRMKARSLRNIQDVDAVIVVLDRVSETKIYYESKKGLGEVFLKSQMIREYTFKSLTEQNNNNRVFTASIIMAQLYGKILPPGQSIWHLAKGAGGIPLDKQFFFMGFDVSRNIDLKREAAAYSAICDPQGRVLTRKSVPFKGERVGAMSLSEWFFDAALDAYESTSGKKKLDCLVLFKDGDIRDSQVSEYEDGCDIAMKRMIKSGLMDPNGNLVIIAAIKRGPYRLFGYGEDEYMIKNRAIVRNESEAILVTCGNGPRGKRALRGTPQPIRLKIIHQVRKLLTIQQVVQIFNDLRYLDYSSLMKQPKTILPLHIVQNLAKLIKEGIEVPYDPR